MKPLEKVTLIIGILIGLLGICATIMYPWPATWIANKCGLRLLTAQLITCASVLVVVGVSIAYILYRVDGPSIIKRVSWNRPQTTKSLSQVRSRIMTTPPNVMPKDFIYNCLLETLSAFEKSLAARYRELHTEHELTRRNLRYHRQKFRELIDMNLLECQTPWLTRLPDTELQPHFTARKEIDKKLEDIYSTLRVWHIRPKYVIALGGHQAGALLRILRKELSTLNKKTHKERLNTGSELTDS